MQRVKPVLLFEQPALFVDNPLSFLGLVIESARLEQAKLI